MEKELASILLMVMDKYDQNEIDFCPQDAVFAVNQTRVKTDLTQIRHLLKKNGSFTPKTNSLTHENSQSGTRGEISRETEHRALLHRKKEIFT